MLDQFRVGTYFIFYSVLCCYLIRYYLGSLLLDEKQTSYDSIIADLTEQLATASESMKIFEVYLFPFLYLFIYLFVQVTQEESDKLLEEERAMHEAEKRKLDSQVKSLSEELISCNRKISDLEVCKQCNFETIIFADLFVVGRTNTAAKVPKRRERKRKNGKRKSLCIRMCRPAKRNTATKISPV